MVNLVKLFLHLICDGLTPGLVQPCPAVLGGHRLHLLQRLSLLRHGEEGTGVVLGQELRPAHRQLVHLTYNQNIKVHLIHITDHLGSLQLVCGGVQLRL